MSLYLNWSEVEGVHRATSVGGTQARIWKSDIFTIHLRVRTADKREIVRRSKDLEDMIEDARDPALATRTVYDHIRREAEGLVMRFDTTGVLDPWAANDAIQQLEPQEWVQKAKDWRDRNGEALRG